MSCGVPCICRLDWFRSLYQDLYGLARRKPFKVLCIRFSCKSPKCIGQCWHSTQRTCRFHSLELWFLSPCPEILRRIGHPVFPKNLFESTWPRNPSCGPNIVSDWIPSHRITSNVSSNTGLLDPTNVRFKRRLDIHGNQQIETWILIFKTLINHGCSMACRSHWLMRPKIPNISAKCAVTGSNRAAKKAMRVSFSTNSTIQGCRVVRKARCAIAL